MKRIIIVLLVVLLLGGMGWILSGAYDVYVTIVDDSPVRKYHRIISVSSNKEDFCPIVIDADVFANNIKAVKDSTDDIIEGHLELSDNVNKTYIDGLREGYALGLYGATKGITASFVKD